MRRLAERAAAGPAAHGPDHGRGAGDSGIRPLETRGRWSRAEGSPVPQGVTWIPEEDALNFALYSKHAERVTLLLFSRDDFEQPLATIPLDYRCHKTDRIWHLRVPRTAVPDADFYAYRIDGPAPTGDPAEAHAFDRDKLLLDPYSRGIHFPPAFDREAARRPGSNLGRAPLGVIHAEPSARPPATPPSLHEADALIYELHVRGFTMADDAVALPERGTFAGLVRKIPYLTDLGVTVVELMPVFQYDPAEGNYWGYMPLGFFALHQAYARGAGAAAARSEFRAMVAAFNEAGLEVVLDVVYNHTGEGGHRGPVYSFKGIDNSTYYFMTGDPESPYLDLAGTGNTLHTENRYVRKLVVDSLRYWAEEMSVDGFRFDLASTFSHQPARQVVREDTGLFGDVVADPVLSRLRLIAEPWDAVGTEQLGRTLPGLSWAQWNSRYQRDVRRFLRGDAGMVPALMRRLYGSDDLFPDDRIHACRPYQSINYVTSHDGFTLYDLVSYEKKRNRANGHDNLDGAAENDSWNCGVEGDEDVPPRVRALRARQARNFMALLLLSNGTPMLRGGDELLQTQGGNNNPYNQDNPTTWLDWGRLEAHGDFHRFVRLMIAFRKTHHICRSRFWRDDVRWYGPDGAVDMGPDSRCLAYALCGIDEDGGDLYVMINGGAEQRDFTIQEGPAESWWRVVDTAEAAPGDILEPGREERMEGIVRRVAPRSVVVLLRPCRSP